MQERDGEREEKIESYAFDNLLRRKQNENEKLAISPPFSLTIPSITSVMFLFYMMFLCFILIFPNKTFCSNELLSFTVSSFCAIAMGTLWILQALLRVVEVEKYLY